MPGQLSYIQPPLLGEERRWLGLGRLDRLPGTCNKVHLTRMVIESPSDNAGLKAATILMLGDSMAENHIEGLKD
jgi:hypothetical protein